MPVLNGPVSIKQVGQEVTLHFPTEHEARRFFVTHTVQARKAYSIGTNDAPAMFHIQRGCCDGSDPAACHKFHEEKEAARVAAERAERRAIREDEYAGTEPTEGDAIFCPNNRGHGDLAMGDRCGTCGWTA